MFCNLQNLKYKETAANNKIGVNNMFLSSCSTPLISARNNSFHKQSMIFYYIQDITLFITVNQNEYAMVPVTFRSPKKGNILKKMH